VIIKKYEQDGLLFNVSFAEAASTAGYAGFRGRLALVEGDVADDKGNRRPPSVVMEHTVLLSKDEKLALIAGSLDKLAFLNDLVSKYKGDFAPETQAIIYVVDLMEPLQVELEGVNFALIPMVEGITWNELLDESGLDKGDLKKLSSADKVYSVWENLKGFKPKGSVVTMEAALSKTDATRTRVERGAL
jgi:hypothetical protein